MQEIIIISVCCWFVAEGSFLMQNLKHWLKVDRIFVLDCAKCLAFWLGLFIQFRVATWSVSFGFDPIQAILCSSIAVVLSKKI